VVKRGGLLNHCLERGAQVRILSPPLMDILLISGAVVYKKVAGKARWFLIKKNQQSEWEIPKTNVRKGESSVRAAIRQMAEEGGIRATVFEEAGRAGGAATVNNEVVPVRYLYYLMSHEDPSGEPVGFLETAWLEYAQAVRKLRSKRERQMLKEARKVLRKLEREKK
jgi:8-oxo-dGTP pyrophosphatase MutT (NUDIX family)